MFEFRKCANNAFDVLLSWLTVELRQLLGLPITILFEGRQVDIRKLATALLPQLVDLGSKLLYGCGLGVFL